MPYFISQCSDAIENYVRYHLRVQPMLKINRQNQCFSRLEMPTLSDVSITERYDLQEFISNSPAEFFHELGLDLFLVGKEIQPSDNVQDRIDLLAVDREGACVVIELKRGSNKLHLLQAVPYAAMISQWEPDEIFQLLDEDRQEALAEFLEVDRESVNRRQRIVLVAENYDYTLLVGAEWLSEKYGIDVICCRISVARDATAKAEYLVCSNVYPAPELANEAVSRGRKHFSSGKVKWADWKTALTGVTNPAVKAFFEQELAKGCDSYLLKRSLRYQVGGKRRCSVAARNKNAYLWQVGRFEGDVEMWREGINNPSDVKAVKRNTCVRVFLQTPQDFAFFTEMISKRLPNVVWQEAWLDDEFNDEGVEASNFS